MEETQKFVSLNRAKDVRINNLESAKECLQVVKIYHQIKKIRAKKIILLKELEKEGKELELLFTKLYEFLPEHKILEIKKRSQKNKVKTKKRSKTNKNLDELEQSLSKIEDRLRKI